MPSKADRIRDAYRKEPDANPSQLAKKLGCSVGESYRIRKELQRTGELAATAAYVTRKPKPEWSVTTRVEDSEEVKRLRRQNAALKKIVLSMLAEEL